MTEFVAAEVCGRAELGRELGIGRRVEKETVSGRRAVIFVREHHDGEIRRPITQEAGVLLRGWRAVSAKGPGDGGELVLESAAALAYLSNALKNGRDVRRQKLLTAPESLMNVAPGCSVVSVHAPVGDARKMPLSPCALQPVIDPLPAPMSEVTTAMCRSGGIPGDAFSTSMNAGRAAISAL